MRNSLLKKGFYLRDSQISLLISLLWEHKQGGSFYGNKNQHYRLVDETLELLGYDQEQEKKEEEGR
jgi:hypothetical protein